MRISDWSSDVCSSDLRDAARHRLKHRPRGVRKPGDCKPRGDPASPAGPHRPAGALSLHKKAPPGFLPTGRLIGLRRPPTCSPSSAGGGCGGSSEPDEPPPRPFARPHAPWPASPASRSNATALEFLLSGLTHG